MATTDKTKEEKKPKTTVKKTAQKLEADVYNQTGKAVGKLSLPLEIFDLDWNGDLVSQVAIAMQANARTPIAHAKTRAEVRGGGRKPWRQKGTGRARVGSKRSPIWVGGGITHGPDKEKSYKQKINKKMKTKALFIALSQKFKKNQILFLEELNIKEIKTKEADKIIQDLSKVSGFDRIYGSKKPNLFITVPAKSEVIKKSFANIKNVKIDEVKNISLLDVLNFRYIIISQPKESIAFLGGKIEKK